MFSCSFLCCIQGDDSETDIQCVDAVSSTEAEQETCKREDLRDIAYCVTGVITVYVANFLGPIS